MSKQRLLFITTGGTIASVRTAQGLKPVLTSEELLAHLPELQQLCCPETLNLCSIDSTDLGPEHWLMMAKAVQENYALYDGFIICHGTDTLAYSAAALSYLVQNADKPIILTGAQQPISNEITDAKKNLRDSVICALDPGSRGVMVVFGGHVIAGTRAKKNKTISYDAFASVNFPALALVQGDRLVRYVASPWPTGPVEFGRALNPKVFLLKLTPGLGPELIPAIFQQYDCVIVESFGVGGIPQRLMDAFAEELGDYDKTHKILILTTQVTYEGSDVGIYEVGKRVKNRFRFLEAHDMTIEAVVTKVPFLLCEHQLHQQHITHRSPVQPVWFWILSYTLTPWIGSITDFRDFARKIPGPDGSCRFENFLSATRGLLANQDKVLPKGLHFDALLW